MIKKVGILCTYKFPEGMAPTVRIRAYGKGLVENGIVVEAIIFQPKSNCDEYPSDGFIDGIHYTYSHVRRPNVSKLHKILFDYPFSILNAFRIISNSHRKQPFDVVLLSFDQLQYLSIFAPVLWLMNINTAFIGDEYPSPIRQLKSELPAKHIKRYKFLYRFIKARVLMTDALKDFYDRIISPKPTYILCSILNTERFINITRERVEHPYLCYMGNMMLAKDNVDNIVEAFSLISNEFPDLELHLYGTPNDQDRAIVEQCIKEHRLENKALLKGRINFDAVPQVLANATILVTSQPITKRAEGGFPTKLAEYMMSHTPAIVTRVGEIDHYVDDRETVFFVPPCNPQEYAAVLRYVLSHPEEASSVANKAFIYASTNFGAKEVTKGLVGFIDRVFGS